MAISTIKPNSLGGAPAFSAYPSSNQAVTTSTYTKVAFQTERFDTNNNFDNATNYRFQPTVAGYYQVNWVVSYMTTGAAAGTFSNLYKNGTVYMWAQAAGNTSAYPSSASSTLVYMNGSTDYLEVFAYQTTGVTLTVLGTSDYTNFSGVFVRGA